jgi:hypothetical protein
MENSNSPSKPATLHSTNQKSDQAQSEQLSDVFAVMKNGSIIEMMPEDMRFLLGGDTLPVAYKVVHINGNTSDFRQTNLDLVRDDVGAAKALQLSKIAEVGAFARRYLKNRC